MISLLVMVVFILKDLPKPVKNRSFEQLSDYQGGRFLASLVVH
jgi:hypothetical protein